jgi:hypothetical protein
MDDEMSYDINCRTAPAHIFKVGIHSERQVEAKKAKGAKQARKFAFFASPRIGTQKVEAQKFASLQ